MHAHRPAAITSPVISLNRAYFGLLGGGGLVGAVGLVISFLMSGGNIQRFLFSWMVSLCALLTMSLGCLFFVIVQHLTRAGWSVTVRRIAEVFALCAAPLFLLFLPVLFTVVAGQDTVYRWNAPDWSAAGATSAFEKLKAVYLNRWFFTGRVVACFAVWGLLAWYFFSTSRRQDLTADPQLSRRMQRNATWMMILFAVTLVFAAFDLEMSLAPAWFSTMFPVYIFAGAFLSGVSVIILTALLLQRSGRITDEITTEHYHDLAKLAFGFIFFWGYISFSQFMLIWYANIPEETFWFDYRINRSGWQTLSLVLLFGHLLIPFLGMMARTVRRSRTYLLFATVYLLVMHWVDHYWIIMPESTRTHDFNMNLLIDIPCAVGMAGLYVSLFALIARDCPLIARHDPRLGDALNYHNH